MLKEEFVRAMNQPYGIIGFHASKGREALSKQFDIALQEGTHTAEDKDEIMKDYDATLIRSSAVQGYPDWQLINNGIDPEYIKYIREVDRRAGR